MNITDLKFGDLARIIEKKVKNIEGSRTIEIEEICSGFVALNYKDDMGKIVDTEYFDVPVASDEDTGNCFQNYLYEAVDHLKILMDSIEPQIREIQ